MTPSEIAEYLKVSDDVIVRELDAGKLHGFKVGKEWRCSDKDLLTYMGGETIGIEFSYPQPQSAENSSHNSSWEIVEIAPFDFKWPKKGGGGNVEHYDKGYEATREINGQEYTFKIGFGSRESAGQIRRRITIWLGNRAIVEFAGSNDYENDGLLAGIIRLKNGKQLTSQKIPEDYRVFRIDRYNSIVRGPRARTAMAVISHKDNLECMLEHAVIRANWKQLL
jgi:excisionase family DNA binding protein